MTERAADNGLYKSGGRGGLNLWGFLLCTVRAALREHPRNSVERLSGMTRTGPDRDHVRAQT